MKLSILASGSTGNSIYIETKEGAFLVDAGLTGKKTEEALKAIDRSPSEINGIFITHEHSDHVAGAGVLSRRHKIPIYANAKTWMGMKKAIGEISKELQFEFAINSVKSFGSLDIESFGVSHDASEPMFYVFHFGKKKIAIITDTGYVSERMKKTIQNADVLIFECNHDVSMVRASNYPWHLQQRILSDRGHISNEDAGLALLDIIGERTKKIYLAHISKENNYKELARITVEQILQSKDCGLGSQFFIYDTHCDKPTKLVEV